MVTTLPTNSFDVLYHIGTMDPNHKRLGSYEGSGLSVSVHPGAWRQIARGHVSGDCWSLTKSNSAFLDAHGLSDAEKSSALSWAAQKGYILQQELWTLSYWDDELESNITQTFTSHEQAYEESTEDEDADILSTLGYISTPLLDHNAKQDRPNIGTQNVLDLILPLWAHEVHNLDGVWWEDRLDPVCYSAPRGVIVPEKLTSWGIQKLEEDPSDTDDW